jgi:hypothetical protein
MGFVILPRGILATKRFSNRSDKKLSRLARLESLALHSPLSLSPRVRKAELGQAKRIVLNKKREPPHACLYISTFREFPKRGSSFKD